MSWYIRSEQHINCIASAADAHFSMSTAALSSASIWLFSERSDAATSRAYNSPSRSEHICASLGDRDDVLTKTPPESPL
jgi:hypothetical protein